MSARQAAELAEGIAQVSQLGLPLHEGLRALADEQPRGRLREAFRALAGHVEKGGSLADGLRSLPDAPDHLHGLFAAGEQSGRWDALLMEFANSRSRADEIRRQLWRSLAYPLLLLAMLLAIYLFVQWWVIGPMAEVAADIIGERDMFGGKAPESLPLTLRALLAVRGFDVVFALAVMLGLPGLWLLARFTRRRAWLHRLAAAIPLFGRQWRFSSLMEWTRLLSGLLEQRVPLPKAVKLSAACLSDGDMARSCHGLAKSLEQGRSLAESIEQQPRLPATLGPLMGWGERNNALPDVLRSTAEMYTARAEAQANLIRAVAPPLMFLVIVAGIGFLAYAMYVASLVHMLDFLAS